MNGNKTVSFRVRCGRRALKLIAPIATTSIGVRAIEALEMFSSALVGRGGGSGWDAKGQNAALSRHVARSIADRSSVVVFDVGANNGAWIEGFSKFMPPRKVSYYLFECAPYCFEDHQ